MRKAALVKFFLGSIFLAYALDLFHAVFHVATEPELWRLEGIRSKVMLKILPLPVFATRPTGCQEARELLDSKGTARDAKETLFGNIKRTPPYGSFPADADKVTWWGVFKPFELWESPEFQAVWINPEGQEAARQSFRGSHCRLAKTTLKAEEQPHGMFQGGMWQVVVTCEDYLIDKQTFAVLPDKPPQRGSPDAGPPTSESTMIWAEDMVKD